MLRGLVTSLLLGLAPLCTAAEDLPAVTVRGAVFDASGAPVEHARINLLSSPDERPETQIPAVLASGSTAADGSFSIPLSDAPPSFRVHVAKEPFAPSLVVAVEPTSTFVEVGSIGLAPPRSLRGRVVDANGKPIAGAEVFVRSANDVGPFEAGDRSATSDAEGRFHVDGLPRAPIELGGIATGFAPAWRERIDLRAPELDDVVLVLPPAQPPHAVVVVGTDGVPLPDATLRWVSAAGAVPFFLSGERGSITAAADGSLAWPATLPPGVRLECSAPGHVTRSFVEKPRDGRVELTRGREAFVRLLDARGEPIPLREVRVESYTRAGDAWERAELRVTSGLARPTDASGWKVLLPVADDVRISVQAADGERCPPVTLDRARLTAGVPAGSTSGGEPLRIDVERGPAFVISGNVRNASGEPLAGERIELQRASPVAGQRQPFRAVRSDAAGHFRFDAVPAGAYVAQGVARGAASAPVEAPVDRAAELGPLTLTMERWREATVTLSESGRPPALPRQLDLRRYEGNPREGAFVVLETSRTDAAGVASFATVPPGELLVVPHAPVDRALWTHRDLAAELPRPDFKYGWPHRLGAAEAPSAQVDTEATEPSWLRVTVLENDRPASGALVEVVVGREIPAAATTGPEGMVHLRIRERGTVALRVTRGSLRADATVKVEPGADTATTLALGVGGVAGRVVGRDGRGLPRLRLSIERRADDGSFGAAAALVTDADGRFDAPTLATGTYRIVTADPERKIAAVGTEPFTVDAGERRTVSDLVAPAAAKLTVKLTATGVERPPFASVTVTCPALPHPVEAWCAEGKVDVGGLPPGPVTIAVKVHGSFTQPDAATADLVEGGAATVTVTTAKL